MKVIERIWPSKVKLAEGGVPMGVILMGQMIGGFVNMSIVRVVVESIRHRDAYLVYPTRKTPSEGLK